MLKYIKLINYAHIISFYFQIVNIQLIAVEQVSDLFICYLKYSLEKYYYSKIKPKLNFKDEKKIMCVNGKMLTNRCHQTYDGKLVKTYDLCICAGSQKYFKTGHK